MGIIIKTLKISNIVPYEEAVMEWNKYNKVLITGINKMPGMSRNAVGKSMLADLLTWTLWGKSPRSISKDTIKINDKKASLAEVSFERDGVDYIVKKTVSPSNIVKLTIERWINEQRDNTFKPQKTIKIAQETINKIFGIDYTTFISVSYFGQDSVNVFLNGTPKEREEVIISFFSMEKWNGYKKIAKDILFDKCQMRSTLSSKLSFYEDLIKGIDPEDISVRKTAAEEMKNKIRNKLQILNSLYGLARQYDKINMELKENEFRLESAESVYKQTIKNINYDIEELSKTLIDSATLSTKVAYKKKLEESFSIANRQMEELIDKKEPITKKIHYYETSKRSCLKNAREWEEIITLKEDRRCPTCNQLLSDKYISFIEDKINKNKGHAKDWEIRIEKDKDILTSIDIKIEKLATRKQSIQAKINEIHTIEGRLYDIKNKKEQIQNKKNLLAKEKASFSNKLKIYNKLIKKQKNELNNIKEKFGDKLMSADKIKELTDIQNQQLVEYENKCTEFKKILSQYRSYKRNMNGIEEQQKILEKEIKLYGYLVESYTNIKLYMIDVINQSLQNQINVLLTKMNINAKVLLDIEYDKKSGDGKISKYGVKINTTSNKEREWRSFSGGEKKRISLAVYFAFQKIAEKFSKQNVNLLLFDEVFGGLDVAGRDMMMELINEYSKYKNIYVITHLEDIMSMFENKIIIVREKNEKSRIVYE